MGQSDNYVQSMSLPANQLRALLDSLDDIGTSSSSNKADARRHRRLRYRTRRATVRVLEKPSDRETVFNATTRNISSRGLAFLHKQMMPLGKRLMLSIPLLDDQTIQVLAEVAHCRHVRGMIHEIGIRFLQLEKDSD